MEEEDIIQHLLFSDPLFVPFDHVYNVLFSEYFFSYCIFLKFHGSFVPLPLNITSSCLNVFLYLFEHIKHIVLVCSSCYSKTPQTGSLKQQKLIFS